MAVALERILTALEDGALELIKAHQAALALRLGADANLTTPAEERADAQAGLLNIKIAHGIMRELVAVVFKP